MDIRILKLSNMVAWWEHFENVNDAIKRVNRIDHGKKLIVIEIEGSPAEIEELNSHRQ